MRLYINKIQDYYCESRRTLGHCRLWFFFSQPDEASVIVLTRMPEDAGAGLYACLGEIATRVMREQGVESAKTLWYVRQVLDARRELIESVEFTHDPVNQTLFDPTVGPASRAEVQALVLGPIPPILDDEYTPLFRTD